MRNSAYEARQVREIIQQLRRLQVQQEALIEDLSSLQGTSNPDEGIDSEHSPVRALRTPAKDSNLKHKHERSETNRNSSYERRHEAAQRIRSRDR